MEGLDLTNPHFWMSIFIGGAILALISGIYQKTQKEEHETIKIRAIVRDGLLGIIFTAMAWNFLPESMNTLTESVSTTMSTTSDSVQHVSLSGGRSKAMSEIDVQFGPARF